MRSKLGSSFGGGAGSAVTRMHGQARGQLSYGLSYTHGGFRSILCAIDLAFGFSCNRGHCVVREDGRYRCVCGEGYNCDKPRSKREPAVGESPVIGESDETVIMGESLVIIGESEGEADRRESCIIIGESDGEADINHREKLI